MSLILFGARQAMAMDRPTVRGSSPDPIAIHGFVRYTGSVPLENLEFPEEPDNPDFDWAINDPEVRRLYSGKVVAVHNRKVWGVGKNFRTAWEDARAKPGCPTKELVFVAIQRLPFGLESGFP
jgi:hypothetical protein